MRPKEQGWPEDMQSVLVKHMSIFDLYSMTGKLSFPAFIVTDPKAVPEESFLFKQLQKDLRKGAEAWIHMHSALEVSQPQ